MSDDHGLPPHVTLDSEKVSTSVKPDVHLLWSELEKVVVVNATAGDSYCESFWVLTGGRAEVVAPVEVVMGADELNARLLALPGFDRQALARARQSESLGRAGSSCAGRR